MKKILKYLNNLLGISEFISYIKKRIAIGKQHRRIRRATLMALARHRTDKRRYYVMYDWEGKYHAFNKNEIDLLKRARILNRKVTIRDLLREATLYVDSTNYEKIKEKMRKRLWKRK